MNKLLHEPMLYFFMIGGALFLIYPDRDEQKLVASDQIVLKKSLKTINTPDADVKTALARYVSDEALYREAWKYQLFQNDTIIRNRLIQKMRFALESDIVAKPPSQAQMKAYYLAHQEQYMESNLWDFEHVFYQDDRELSLKAMNDIRNSLNQQRKDVVSPNAFYLGNIFRRQNEQKLRNGFGESFVQALHSLDPTQKNWQGPIKSLYGWHVVKVRQKVMAKPKTFEMVRPTIYETMMKEKQEKQLQQKIQAITKKYPIVYE